MPQRSVGVADAVPAAGTVADIDVIERGSSEANARTTLTADPGSGGTGLALTGAVSADASGWKIKVENEVMLVTAGGSGTTPTVTRGVDGTAAVAHGIGSVAARMVGVQRVEPVDGSREVLFRGRAMSFRTPGRAGTTGQKILSLHNATASPIRVRVTSVIVDLVATVVKAVTVLPPVIRVWKVTVLPTNGTALNKTPLDSSQASNSAVTVLGDASADGTGSGTALTATLPAGTFVTQEFAPRLITAVGYEMFDREVFFDGEDAFITLNALEGIVVFVDYVLATQNPVTDMWLAGLEWEEYRVN